MSVRGPMSYSVSRGKGGRHPGAPHRLKNPEASSSRLSRATVPPRRAPLWFLSSGVSGLLLEEELRLGSPRPDCAPGWGLCSDGPGGLGCLTGWITPLPAPPRGPERPEGGAALEPRSQSGETNKQPSVHPFPSEEGPATVSGATGTARGPIGRPPISPSPAPRPGALSSAQKKGGQAKKKGKGPAGGKGGSWDRPQETLQGPSSPSPPPPPLTASPPTLSVLGCRR